MNKRTWQDIGSDINWIDYGGMWARHNSDSRYFVIGFTNMWEASGEEYGDKYDVTLQEVDINSGQLIQAYQCCGIESDGLDEHGEPITDLAKVYALLSYGAYSPLWSDSGNNAHQLIREAKRAAYQLQRDATAYETAMERPVNALGSTAREYGQGDINSAVLRGLAEGDKNAEIIAKMMIACSHSQEQES